MLNKKGQVAETLTWIISTIVIVVIIMFFVFGASMLGSTKSIKKYKDSLFSRDSKIDDDLFMRKSLYTYLTLKEDSLRRKIDLDMQKQDASGKFDIDYNSTKVDIMRRSGL